jgi:hypothetical protein
MFGGVGGGGSGARAGMARVEVRSERIDRTRSFILD